MSEPANELPTTPPAPKPAKRKARRRLPAAIPAAAKPSVCAGITALKCCDGCNPAEGCVISRGGTGICAHPKKCGLPSKDALDRAIVKRFAEARRIIDHQRIDDKNPVR